MSSQSQPEEFLKNVTGKMDTNGIPILDRLKNFLPAMAAANQGNHDFILSYYLFLFDIDTLYNVFPFSIIELEKLNHSDRGSIQIDIISNNKGKEEATEKDSNNDSDSISDHHDQSKMIEMNVAIGDFGNDHIVSSLLGNDDSPVNKERDNCINNEIENSEMSERNLLKLDDNTIPSISTKRNEGQLLKVISTKKRKTENINSL
jgi:hypothetical protein